MLICLELALILLQFSTNRISRNALKAEGVIGWDTLTAETRTQQAIEMRSMGVDYDFIAKELGYHRQLPWKGFLVPHLELQLSYPLIHLGFYVAIFRLFEHFLF